ncbi:hypothetical protein, conserved in T. vivax [Trypanosoma vivax Y486]|uniref:Uncharacterized protein n=1 Tax=Trypanosoma vivax (strain Y486) TaxID=1055687 RepID=F9WNT1_TRYVY|nr:hypothetical protein, conserved in T. vivax [Trypanosoma vivax Y486]|eukprot:CCD19202.1 hypothetical protein, conserved in T. vivax [Trypanosoma vivax Y486]
MPLVFFCSMAVALSHLVRPAWFLRASPFFLYFPLLLCFFAVLPTFSPATASDATLAGMPSSPATQSRVTPTLLACPLILCTSLRPVSCCVPFRDAALYATRSCFCPPLPPTSARISLSAPLAPSLPLPARVNAVLAPRSVPLHAKPGHPVPPTPVRAFLSPFLHSAGSFFVAMPPSSRLNVRSRCPPPLFPAAVTLRSVPVFPLYPVPRCKGHIPVRAGPSPLPRFRYFGLGFPPSSLMLSSCYRSVSRFPCAAPTL